MLKSSGVVFGLFLSFSVACKKETPPPVPVPESVAAVPAPIVAAVVATDAGGNEALPVRANRYTVQGIVRSAPAANKAGKTITILHQAIPTFKNRDGEETGMMSMAMPFQVAAEAGELPLSVGDKVEFTFDVDWDAQNPTTIVKITKLSADAEIRFGE
jgi:Cu/Ag efflux protein CusF